MNESHTNVETDLHSIRDSNENRPRARKGWMALAAFILAGILFAFLRHGSPSVTAQVPAEGVPVAVAKVGRKDIGRELVFESEFRPFQEVDLHAKVAGYLESIKVDIGDHVKEGEEIATLEIPELESEMEHAVASQRRSEEEIHRDQAAYDEAHLIFKRLAGIDKARPNLIAQQDIEAAQAKDKTAEATLAAAKEQVNVASADVKKLRALVKYARIVAPFSGVITKRYVDKGALIQAGTASSTQALPLVRLSEDDRLRLVFPVSVTEVAQIRTGLVVEVRVPALGKTIKGAVTRSTRKIDFATRSMDTEVDVENPDLALIPGMYAYASIQVDKKKNVLVLPVEALSQEKSPSVYLINQDNIVEKRPIKLGLATPSVVEVLSGVKEGDMVLIGSRDIVKPGQRVVPKLQPAMDAE